MITVSDLKFSYVKTNQLAIKGLNFKVEPGEIFGFLGPSGAGKSTTQKILIGLLRGYQGAVRVFGNELSNMGSDYYERIGVSFELPNHYLKLTGNENLIYFSSLYKGKKVPAAKLLDMVGLGNDGDTLVSQYSKGMKNRLSVARSLLHNPELLFLDEPTAGLDPVNSRRIKELIKAQKMAGKTIFLTTHDMMVADELCDRIAFIVDGEIQLIDAPGRLKIRYGEQKVRLEYLNGFSSKDSEGIRLTERCEFPLPGLGDNIDFLQILRQKEVQTIHTLEATLEEIFIKVTGRSLT